MIYILLNSYLGVSCESFEEVVVNSEGQDYEQKTLEEHEEDEPSYSRSIPRQVVLAEIQA